MFAQLNHCFSLFPCTNHALSAQEKIMWKAVVNSGNLNCSGPSKISFVRFTSSTLVANHPTVMDTLNATEYFHSIQPRASSPGPIFCFYRSRSSPSLRSGSLPRVLHLPFLCIISTIHDVVTVAVAVHDHVSVVRQHIVEWLVGLTLSRLLFVTMARSNRTPACNQLSSRTGAAAWASPARCRYPYRRCH